MLIFIHYKLYQRDKLFVLPWFCSFFTFHQGQYQHNQRQQRNKQIANRSGSRAHGFKWLYKTQHKVIGTVVAKVMELYTGGPFRALHTKLYRASDGRLYALVTATASGELIAVDVTDPRHPEQVGALHGLLPHRNRPSSANPSPTRATNERQAEKPRLEVG